MGRRRQQINREKVFVIRPCAYTYISKTAQASTRVPACQSKLREFAMLLDVHTMIGTRWYTTHARCRTEERKQNIIYIAGVRVGVQTLYIRAETKMVYTSGCSPRSNRWPVVGGETARDLRFSSATSLGGGGNNGHYNGPRAWQGRDVGGRKFECTVRWRV